MKALRRRGILAVFSGVMTVSMLAGPAYAQTRTAPRLAALGDSYSSGVGTRTYYQNSGSCKRSPKAYPVLDSQRIGATLTFVACAAATTADVQADQLDALSTATNDVTMTIGGNDIGFAEIITLCALPSRTSACLLAIDAARALITNVLPGRLDALYADIARDAPNAQVTIVGYPRLFNGEDCNAGTFFTRAEETALNNAANLLDGTIHGRASAAGFGYVDPRAAFTGHAICDNVEWINGLSNPVSESFHPNVLGQAGYAQLVAGHLGSLDRH